MSGNEPFFSIVVPTYNRANLIAHTLDSLTNQEAKNYEIIIVDDGSTDNTAEVVKKYTALDNVSYSQKENAERGAARNYGAVLAKGDYVNFFDSDDIALPNHISVATEMVKKNSRPEVFHLSFQWKDSSGKIFQKCRLEGEINKEVLKHNPMSTNGVFVRKDIALENKFSEIRSLSGTEDWELWLRLALKFPIHSSGEITSCMINHDSRSVLEQNVDRIIERIDVLFQEVDKSNSFSAKQKKLIRCEGYSYIALHAAIGKSEKAKGWKYLKKALCINPLFILKRRCYATIKNLVI